ncbi:hypothetical protein EVAR_14576_1 [Eumeta japonica]|uniref:Uncharacterized protein n=1 Tax=Eumeta variegata TaxID=151549 RepID=A0A4C1UUT4_EUMVA|nr:hypothetical protein EVAR_14576_1 [Eumeta japonica]
MSLVIIWSSIHSDSSHSVNTANWLAKPLQSLRAAQRVKTLISRRRSITNLATVDSGCYLTFRRTPRKLEAAKRRRPAPYWRRTALVSSQHRKLKAKVSSKAHKNWCGRSVASKNDPNFIDTNCRESGGVCQTQRLVCVLCVCVTSRGSKL